MLTAPTDTDAPEPTPGGRPSLVQPGSRSLRTTRRTARRALGCPRRQSQVRLIAPLSGRAPTAAPTPCTTPAEICVPGTRTPPPTGPPTRTPAPERDVPEAALGSTHGSPRLTLRAIPDWIRAITPAQRLDQRRTRQ